MRIIVTGSREWGGVYGTNRIHAILDKVHELAHVLGQKLTVVHGDYVRGADRIVDSWARRREADGVTVEPHPAQWSVLGKRAGPMRDQAMVDKGADMCIGFVRGTSPGTQLTLALARNAGIPAFTVYWEEEVE